MAKLYNTRAALLWFEKYMRYVNYISAAQLYLKSNFLLRLPLTPEHVKDRILGHWGTVPGLNFIYAHCNYLITQRMCNMLLIVGPGHGAPGVLSNLFVEGTLAEYYEHYALTGKGMGALIHDFSWPGGFPSHLNPGTPGSILEGGELGYSLSTAYGAVLDNPDLIAVCVVGDGEAESGPLAASWHSNKFLYPAESGAVLPILHVNGYKISGPTIYSTMSNRELLDLFHGFGYNPRIVQGARLHEKMMEAMRASHDEILRIQRKACSGAKVTTPHWPLIILRSTKGWTGVKEAEGKKVEGNFRSHGIPIADCKTNPKTFALLNQWLTSYRIHELVDRMGRPLPEVLAYVPNGHFRMGMNKHTIGGNMRIALKMPPLATYAVKFTKPGLTDASNTHIGAQFIRDLIVANKKNFRFMCPDETDSNKMAALFEVTGRAYVWPLQAHDENMDASGRVMEILSEHTLQGWLQGYLLTGRHGIFATYEAFATIVTSMVDQYAKFLKQSQKVPWRKPISSLNYLLTSLGWRQEHNGYSHQNPSFVSNVLEKHGDFCSVYFPADANSLLVTIEDCFKRRNAINVIVAGKQQMPQWLSLDEARKQHRVGVDVWEWAHPGSKNPDLVMAAAGDHMTLETMAAVDILKEAAPQLNIRVVNISELTSLGIGDERHPFRLGDKQFEKYFTADRPIIFNYHGYPDDVKKLVWNHPAATRMSLHGYKEEGTTTTPFDMHVRNGTSRFHLVMDALIQGAKVNTIVAKKTDKLIKKFEQKLTAHQKYIVRHGKDMPEIEEWKWK